jgi:glycosyltransferase involved in cell wall biosynthesis
MISRLKLLILINWKEGGGWSFLRFLNNMVQNVDILQPVSFKRAVNSRLVYISSYLSEFYVPFMAVFRKMQYDVIVSWQMRIGICYGILKRIVHSNRPPVHIIQDFHIDLTRTGWRYGLQIALMKLAIPGIDYFFCTSTEEEKIYSQRFGISRNRIVFLPLMAPQSNFEEPDRPRKDYIFSYGNSDRDFDVLIQAVARMNITTYILSQKYQSHIPIPTHVSIIRDRVSEKELNDWITSSRIVVLPLNDYRIAAGQLSMLEVMALARPLIITENMATSEYAVHHQSALFFEAGNDKELADHIRYLWNHREAAEQIGRQARQAALELNDRRMTVFGNMLERCAMDIQKGERQ